MKGGYFQATKSRRCESPPQQTVILLTTGIGLLRSPGQLFSDAQCRRREASFAPVSDMSPHSQITVYTPWGCRETEGIKSGFSLFQEMSHSHDSSSQGTSFSFGRVSGPQHSRGSVRMLPCCGWVVNHGICSTPSFQPVVVIHTIGL